MKDEGNTKEQLIKEATELRTRIKGLEENLGAVLKERTDEITKANKQLQKELTGRRKFEQELKQSEERFQNLVETANIGIVAAESGVITQVNKKAEEIYGYTREELIGRPPSILAPERYKKQHKEILEKMLNSAQLEQLAFEEEGVRKDGSLFPVEMSFSLSKREDGFGVIAVMSDITERRKAEEEIKETKDFLENIFKTTADGIMIIDDKGFITMSNDAAAKILGYSADELIEKHAKDFIPEEEKHKEKGMEFFAKLMDEGIVTGREFVWLRSDGSLIDVELNATLLKDVEGNTTGGVISARDISERIKNRKQIALFREFAEASNQGLGMADLDGYLTYVNPPLCRLFGEEKPEDAIGKSLDNYYPQEQLSKLKNEILPAVLEQGNQVVEISFLSSGKLISTIQSIFVIRDEKGAPLCLANVVTDITERKLAEEELKKTKEHLDNVIESSADSIIIGDSAGILTRVNKAFLELLGREEEEVIGKQAAELSITEEGTYESTTGEMLEIDEKFFDGLKTLVERLYVEGKMSNWETYYLRKDKKVVPVEMSIVFLYDSEGIINGSVGINRDITERKKMEMQLKEATVQLVQSEKLSALGELTAGVAHELNQPLNGIKIISQSLLKDIERGQLDEGDLGQDLKDVVNQVNKMAEIIDHMRIFTRRSEGVPQERIDLNDIVEGAFKFLGQQLRNHNIEVQENLGSDLPKVVGDPIRLEQVFLNLVSNARSAVEGGGKEKKRIGIRTYADNTNGDSSVVIEVKDNGGGVPEHARGKIFQPFFTTNAPGKGTGLGLSVSSKIIEEHRGRIELDSTLGEGTTFRVILPAVD